MNSSRMSRPWRGVTWIVACALAVAFVAALPSVAYAGDWPNLASASYSAPKNPFAAAGYGGQCTAFAWGRANEKLGINFPARGNAATWYNNAPGYQKGSTPQADAIAVWTNGGLGHVAYVERVNGSTVVFNEANWHRYKATNWGGGYDGAPESLSTAAMQQRGSYRLLGYIYLRPAYVPPPTPQPVYLWVASAYVNGNAPGSWPVGTQRFTTCNFSAPTGPWYVNARTGPGTNYPVARTLPPNTKLTFSAWQHGTLCYDGWTGARDARWYAYRIR